MTSLTTSLSSSPQPQAGGANGAVTFLAKAYQNIAKDLEVFERQIAESETRRRKLRDDYDRLRGSRTKQVEDAEVIEP